MNVPEHRVDQLLTVILDFQGANGLTLDLSTGYTANVRVAQVDAPNTLVYTVTSPVLDDEFGNYIYTVTPDQFDDLLDGWGGTQGTYGDIFRFEAQIIRTSDSMPIPWPGRRIEYRLLPPMLPAA